MPHRYALIAQERNTVSQLYRDIAERARGYVTNGITEQEAVRKAIEELAPQQAESIARDSDRHRMFEAGERIAESNRQLESANKTKDRKDTLAPAQQLNPGNRANDRTLQLIKNTRDSLAHPEAGTAQLHPSEYQDYAKRAANEAAARAKTLSTKMEDTGPSRVAEYRKEAIGRASAQLEGASQVLAQVAKGPAQASALTIESVQRAANMQKIEATSYAKAYGRSNRLSDNHPMAHLANERAQVTHNFPTTPRVPRIASVAGTAATGIATFTAAMVATGSFTESAQAAGENMASAVPGVGGAIAAVQGRANESRIRNLVDTFSTLTTTLGAWIGGFAGGTAGSVVPAAGTAGGTAVGVAGGSAIGNILGSMGADEVLRLHARYVMGQNDVDPSPGEQVVKAAIDSGKIGIEQLKATLEAYKNKYDDIVKGIRTRGGFSVAPKEGVDEAEVERVVDMLVKKHNLKPEHQTSQYNAPIESLGRMTPTAIAQNGNNKSSVAIT